MLRVLLVEDDPDVAAISKAVLEHLGYLVITANDGRQGLELIKTAQPDVVITDAMMPVMSGLEMIEQARDVHYAGPIVVCSAIPEHDYRNRHVRYDAFLQKPYRVNDLAMVLANLQNSAVISLPCIDNKP